MLPVTAKFCPLKMDDTTKQPIVDITISINPNLPAGIDKVSLRASNKPIGGFSFMFISFYSFYLNFDVEFASFDKKMISM